VDQLSVISFTVLFGPQGAIFKLPCFPRSTIILNQFKEPIRGIIKDSNGITLQKHTKAKSDDQHRKKIHLYFRLMMLHKEKEKHFTLLKGFIWSTVLGLTERVTFQLL
jgi:hypothetical protein